MTFSAIERIYGNNVLQRKKTLDEVPEKIRENVKSYVLSEDPSFFDVVEDTPVEEEVDSTDKKHDRTPVSGGAVEDGE